MFPPFEISNESDTWQKCYNVNRTQDKHVWIQWNYTWTHRRHSGNENYAIFAMLSFQNEWFMRLQKTFSSISFLERKIYFLERLLCQSWGMKTERTKMSPIMSRGSVIFFLLFKHALTSSHFVELAWVPQIYRDRMWKCSTPRIERYIFRCKISYEHDIWAE